MNTLRLDLTRVDVGSDVYGAQIYINGKLWGYVQQRRGGAYEAYRTNKRFVAMAPRLSLLQEEILRQHAREEESAVPQARSHGDRPAA